MLGADGGRFCVTTIRHYLSQQIAAVFLEVLAKPLERVHVVRDCHRISSFVILGRFSKVDAVVVACGGRTWLLRSPRTPRPWTQLREGEFVVSSSRKGMQK